MKDKHELIKLITESSDLFKEKELQSLTAEQLKAVYHTIFTDMNRNSKKGSDSGNFKTSC
jgi:hypothetical protein